MWKFQEWCLAKEQPATIFGNHCFSLSELGSIYDALEGKMSKKPRWSTNISLTDWREGYIPAIVDIPRSSPLNAFLTLESEKYSIMKD